MLSATPVENNLRLDIAFPDSDQTIRVLGTSENPLWVASDICKLLGHANAASSLQNFEDDEKGTEKVCTPGGLQSLLVVTEIGLYRLLFRSNKPAARRLQRWVFSDVLPSIRKHGVYPPPSVPVDSTALVLRELADQREVNQALTQRVDTLETQLQEVTARANERYITLGGYCRMKGTVLSMFDASRHGKGLTKFCRTHGIRVGSAPDAKYGYVNCYPFNVVDQYFKRRKLTN